MAAALGGLGLLQGRVRLAAAAAATSALGRPGRRAPVRGSAAAALPSAGRSYGSEVKEEEELRVRYLDDEHKEYCAACARYTLLSWHLLATLMGENEV